VPPINPSPFHPNRVGLVAPMRVDRTGRMGPTPAQARSSRWRRSSHGLYVPSWTDPTLVEQRIVEAAAVASSGAGYVTGWAALRWLGGRWFEGRSADGEPLPVDLAMRRYIRPQPGIAICEEGIDQRTVRILDGLPITNAVRSVAFAMRYANDVRAAVQVFDMAAFNDLVSWQEMTSYAGMAPRLNLSSWTGMPQYREAMGFADENTWSPQEVTMRLIWQRDAGLPRPLMNTPVFDLSGRHIGTPDLLDVEAGVVGEYNGELHLEGTRRAIDVRREEAFRNVGLECFTMLAGDSANRPLMAARMIAARDRAGWIPEGRRAWTIVPPPWWIQTLTVDQRRSLSEGQRRRLLRNRAA
jgi:hypothetical protein